MSAATASHKQWLPLVRGRCLFELRKKNGSEKAISIFLSLSLKRGICAWCSISLHLLRLRGRPRPPRNLTQRAAALKVHLSDPFPSESESSSISSQPRTPLTRWRAEVVLPVPLGLGVTAARLPPAPGRAGCCCRGRQGSTCKRRRPREHVCRKQTGAELENKSEMPNFLQHWWRSLALLSVYGA